MPDRYQKPRKLRGFLFFSITHYLKTSFLNKHIYMKRMIIPLFSLLLLTSCGSGSSDNASGNDTEESSSSSSKPTKQDIIKSLEKQNNMEGSPGSPRRSIEIHDVKIGATEATNEQDRIDGIPAKSDVTMAKVEYTHRTHYTDATKCYRETGTFKVYRDDFGEWKAMRDGTEGTKYFDEPANP
jgi:hypothetical protein